MKHTPLTPTTSTWQRQRDTLGIPTYAREVDDGVLRVLVQEHGAPVGWHLSISHYSPSEPVFIRYPSWDEIAEARDLFLPDDKEFMMVFPRRGEFVNLHKTTFHLYEVVA